MTGKEDTNGEPSIGFDPAIQSEKLGFDPEQMVACGSCGRTNPPNRLACLYCGKILSIDPTSAADLRPGLRKPDAWQRGFNLILSSADGGGAIDIARASQILSLEPDELAEILTASLLFPIARLETERDAEILSEILFRLSLSTLIVSDDALAGDRPPRRLRSIKIAAGSVVLTLFNTGEEIPLPAPDLLLAVEGVISESRIDELEKRRLRGSNKVLEGTSSSFVEPVLDLYARDDQTGYRVQPGGFDFSGLGDEKGILSAENFRILTERIVSFSPNLKYISDYRHLRQLLGRVWEIESHQENTGLRHTGLGQKAFGTVSSTSNENQFTKFSRLQRQVL